MFVKLIYCLIFYLIQTSVEMSFQYL